MKLSNELSSNNSIIYQISFTVENVMKIYFVCILHFYIKKLHIHSFSIILIVDTIDCSVIKNLLLDYNYPICYRQIVNLSRYKICSG